MEIKEQISSLIKKALEGRLSLNELYSTWPDTLEGDSFYERIYDHVESAVEHYPGDLITGKPDTSKFLKSGEYERLKKDLKLLESK